MWYRDALPIWSRVCPRRRAARMASERPLLTSQRPAGEQLLYLEVDGVAIAWIAVADSHWTDSVRPRRLTAYFGDTHLKCRIIELISVRPRQSGERQKLGWTQLGSRILII